MARKKIQPHPVLSAKEEEDIVFGKVRAGQWMKGKVPSKRGGSSRVSIKRKPRPGITRAMDRKLGTWRAKKAGQKGIRGAKSGGKIMQGYKAGGKV